MVFFEVLVLKHKCFIYMCVLRSEAVNSNCLPNETRKEPRTF